jgi:hypothetical protein
VRRILALLVIAAVPAVASARWWDQYDRGVKAVNAREYAIAVAALQAAIKDQPGENASLRAGNKIITYVPHFWLGIAKFNAGDIDGALAEWKTSENHRAILRTDYAATLGEWVSRAQAEKTRLAKEGAASSRKSADGALSRALAAQAAALSAGTDRSDTYRRGQQKLKDALAHFNAAGNDTALLDRAAAAANQASELFANADIQQQGQEREPKRRSGPVQPAEAKPAAEEEPEGGLKPVPASDPEVARRRRELETAYRAFARGELDIAEQLLDATLLTWRSGEVYLLRGCTRYTRSVLTRSDDLASASSDFKLALLLRPELTLDRRVFSPKLVKFFEQVKSGN